MATKLKQIQSLKQKLAPRQVLQARLLQLNTVNLEQAIIEELEQNPLLEQVEVEEVQPEQNSDETPIDEIDVSMEICTAMSPLTTYLSIKVKCRCLTGILFWKI